MDLLVIDAAIAYSLQSQASPGRDYVLKWMVLQII